ncbi:MAG: signal peptidase II [Waddliaceae bacterium]
MTAKAPKGKKRVKKVKTSRLGRSLIPFFIGCFLLFADAVTKYYTHTSIPRMDHEAQWYPYNGIGLFENFFGIEGSIVHATNRGAAWGMFSDFQNYLLLFRLVFIAGLFVYILFFNRNRFPVIPLTLILVGAIGNILDYFIYGHVVDMFHFVFWGYDYPVFNLADSTIFIGICGISLVSLIKYKYSPKCRA